VSAAALWALVLVTWRERLSRPWFGTFCLAICGSYVVMAAGQATLEDPVFILTLMIGGGSIGRDVSSGVLPLLFTRPLLRGRYVLAKWLALASAVAALSALTLLIQAAWLAHRGVGVPGVEVAATVFTGVSAAFGLTAVLLPLSVLVPGYSDVMVWLGLGLLPTLASRFIPQRITEEWRMFLQPQLEWGTTFGTAPIGWFRVLSYFSTVTLCLCLAVVAANRKELSYASG
jgi:ABC-type transport system involved in multi-copper enzyme maturation permease subunit